METDRTPYTMAVAECTRADRAGDQPEQHQLLLAADLAPSIPREHAILVRRQQRMQLAAAAGDYFRRTEGTHALGCYRSVHTTICTDIYV